ncbi:MAG: ribose 5-phosphate isomerase [Desulfuromonadales bacterium]|jgi:ribose 5-phosphate isomerase B|nr:ribose 5-phosphate isomerase [Desulfuromonadales bacterium]
MFLIASDHGGLDLKEHIKAYLKERGIEVRDLGTDNGDSVDYPDFGERVGKAISIGEAEKGILICGTGIGMSIVANKFPGVRAALIWDEFTARMSKEHNNANVVVMGGRTLSEEKAERMVGIWLDSKFEGGRHQKRLDKISQIEDDIRAGRL